jgi:2-oxoglutarate dehydrogenase E1 component
MSTSLKDQYASTPLFGANGAAVEALYEQYLQDPAAVPAGWRDYFDTLGSPDTEIAHSTIREDLLQQAKVGGRRKTRKIAGRGGPAASGEKQAAVSRLIQVYALRGHQIAKIDPIGLMERPVPGVLRLDYLGPGRYRRRAYEAARYHRAAQIDLLRHDRCGIRAYLASAGTPMAAQAV